MKVIDWLLEGDPSIRWQVEADLLNQPPGAVAIERNHVASEGWGKALLDLQQPDGQWGEGFYSPKWVSTTYTLLQLRHYGLDPSGDASRGARDRLIKGGTTWRPSVNGGGGAPFFGYIGETCVTAMNVALACYFDAVNTRTTQAVEDLLGQQMSDGGWNCQVVNGSVRSSFHTTISTLEGLLEFERSVDDLPLRDLSASARKAGHEYLLERQMMRSLSTGKIIEESWTRFSFPPRWWYDVLRGLDYLRDADVEPDSRWNEALVLLEQKQTKDRRWKLQNHHSGREHFRMEESGKPSRWNTLRAMRVLRHAGRRRP
jgi:hypothetical protein